MKPVLRGAVVAFVLALVLISQTVPAAAGRSTTAVPIGKPAASPICAIYTPDDVQWYWFFCYLKRQASNREAGR